MVQTIDMKRKNYVTHNTQLFGHKLYHFRTSIRLTKKELANLMNVKSCMITLYEEGKAYPKIEIIDFLIQHFNLTQNDLYDDILYYQLNLKEEIAWLHSKLSYTQIAKEIGSNHSTVSDWEQKGRCPSHYTIKKLIKLKKKLL